MHDDPEDGPSSPLMEPIQDDEPQHDDLDMDLSQIPNENEREQLQADLEISFSDVADELAGPDSDTAPLHVAESMMDSAFAHEGLQVGGKHSRNYKPLEFGRMKSHGEEDDGSALAEGGVVDIYRINRMGYLLQYFAVGIIYGGLPSTVYGLFLGYLNVPAYVYSTAAVITTLPWTFKFGFGMLNDCCPIFGYRRKPYMVIGWFMCFVMLVVLSFYGLPEPYWCIDPNTGEFITEVLANSSSSTSVSARELGAGFGNTSIVGTNSTKMVPAEPCNAEAATLGGQYAALMCMAAMGYVLADVAADGLTVEYARREPESQRGNTQTTVYMTRTIGQIFASLLVGFCMNGKQYNGSFDWSLSFNQICGIFAIPAAIMVPISWLFIEEKPARMSKSNMTFRRYLGLSWNLLTSKAMFFVIMYQFCTPVVGGIQTTAGGDVKRYWAGVKSLQNQLFSIVGSCLFAFGLWLVKSRFLNTSWRKMLVVTSLFLNLVDMVFVFCTVFDVYRNQYFYLGETVIIEVPNAANFVVSTYVIVEMAENGNEGLVYGLLTTTWNLGSPFARAIGNQIYRLFTPSLSDADNYIADTPAFRQTVGNSFVLSYFFSFLALGFVVLLPNQKKEAQHRKRHWSSHSAYGYIIVTLLASAFTYSLTVNFLSMFPSTMCLKIAGGDGCPSESSGNGNIKNSTIVIG